MLPKLYMKMETNFHNTIFYSLLLKSNGFSIYIFTLRMPFPLSLSLVLFQYFVLFGQRHLDRSVWRHRTFHSWRLFFSFLFYFVHSIIRFSYFFFFLSILNEIRHRWFCFDSTSPFVSVIRLFAHFNIAVLWVLENSNLSDHNVTMLWVAIM